MPLTLASTLLYMKSIVTRQVVSTGPLQRDWGNLVPDSAAAGLTFHLITPLCLFALVSRFIIYGALYTSM
jgi:hypothetical protein